MPHPDRFYPVVDSVEWVVRLAHLGVRTVQLRAKNISHEEAVAMVRAALAATKDTRTEIVVRLEPRAPAAETRASAQTVWSHAS